MAHVTVAAAFGFILASTEAFRVGSPAFRPGGAARIARPVSSGLPLPQRTPIMMAAAGLPGIPAQKALGWGDQMAKAIVSSPAFEMLKEKARDMMVKGAEKRGLDWSGIVAGLEKARNWERMRTEILANSDVVVPEYYLKQFHAYGEGNLCWQAAFEQEIASVAVGIRSYPEEGLNAENRLRQEFRNQMHRLGADVEEGGAVVDFGCGTGSSSRSLAEQFPQASHVVGVDLSPYMLAVGKHQLQERGLQDKVTLLYGDVADTRMPDGCASLVCVSYVLHELPEEAARDVLAEAFRLLKPGGSVAIMDMDPDAPGYAKLRNNPFLYSIVRATEPYLDEWFANAPHVHETLAQAGFSVVRKVAVTGRHMAVVATKAGSLDLRPGKNARLAMDHHLKTWQT